MCLFFKENSPLCKNKVGKISVAAVHFFCRIVTGKHSFWWRTDWCSLEGSDHACMPSDWSHTPQHMDICYEVNRHVLEHAVACSLPPRIFACNTHIQTTIEVHIRLQRTPRNALRDDSNSERSSTVYELPSVFNWQIIRTYVRILRSFWFCEDLSYRTLYSMCLQPFLAKGYTRYYGPLRVPHIDK